MACRVSEASRDLDETTKARWPDIDNKPSKFAAPLSDCMFALG